MESQVQKQTERARIRAQFRSVVGTTFFLLLVLALASVLRVVKPPLTYILFSLIFVVDFSLQSYLIWKYKIYWLSSRHIVEGGKARAIATVYALLGLACILFGIIAVTR